MGQHKSEHRGFKSYAYAGFRCDAVVCKSEHQDFKKAKESAWDSASLRKEVLSKVLKKTLETRFKELKRSKALKNKDRKKKQSKKRTIIEKRSNEGCAQHTWTQLSVCLSILCPLCISCHSTVRFSSNKGVREKNSHHFISCSTH
jgi:hypothetical protein